MKIGVFSDLHDNLQHLDQVKEGFIKNQVEQIFFCGDFSAPFAMRGFIDFNLPIKAVLGNNDSDIEKFLYQLGKIPELKDMQMDLHFRFHDFMLENRRIAIIHGDEPSLLDVLIESQFYDAIFRGHTHKPSIEQKGKTLLVNPGALVGWMYDQGGKCPYSYAIYDTNENSAVIYSIE